MYQLLLTDILKFRISVLENNFYKLGKWIYLGLQPQVLQHVLWKTVPLAVSTPCSILVSNT